MQTHHHHMVTCMSIDMVFEIMSVPVIIQIGVVNADHINVHAVSEDHNQLGRTRVVCVLLRPCTLTVLLYFVCLAAAAIWWIHLLIISQP